MKRIALLLVLAAVLSLPAFLQAAQSPEALVILDQYKATMEKQSRIWFTCVIAGESQEVYTNVAFKHLAGNRRLYDKHEVRFDGTRIADRFSQWGQTLSVARVIPEKDAIYHSRLWDGTNLYSYDKTIKPATNPDEVQIRGKSTLDKTDFYHIYAGARFFCALDFPGQRIDEILREAKDLKVRPEKELVNGASCFVLEGKTPEGKYTVCFDPDRGHQIVRAHVIRNPGDIWPNSTITIKQGQRIAYQISDVRLISTNGTWIPVQATISSRREYLGNQSSQAQQKITITELRVNPDFEKAFVPDDIVDGTIVTHIDQKRVRLTWENGQVKK